MVRLCVSTALNRKSSSGMRWELRRAATTS